MEVNTQSTTIVPVAKKPCVHPIERNAKDLLMKIIDESVKKLNAGVSAAAETKHKICKVPDLLRKNQNNTKSFDPEVVAIGPYHRGKPDLEPMEDHKRAAAGKFTSGNKHSIDYFYNKVKDVAGQARTFYADESSRLCDEEFTLMLFFDGCFVLHFIELFVKNKTTELNLSTHHPRLIMRDIFLFENQLPFIVLDALMSLKPVKLHDFVNIISGTVSQTPEETSCPDHLLDLLRTEMLGPALNPRPAPILKEDSRNRFLSAMDLREVGIKFVKNSNNRLRNIRFKSCILCGKLSLPMIIIDDLSRSRFLNMIALEMSLDGASDNGIASFVRFIRRLIDRPDDVAELRAGGILLNALGSDEQVSELFDELATDLAPDLQAYSQAVTGITSHCDSKVKVSIYRFMRTHFSKARRLLPSLLKFSH